MRTVGKTLIGDPTEKEDFVTPQRKRWLRGTFVAAPLPAHLPSSDHDAFQAPTSRRSEWARTAKFAASAWLPVSTRFYNTGRSSELNFLFLPRSCRVPRDLERGRAVVRARRGLG